MRVREIPVFKHKLDDIIALLKILQWFPSELGIKPLPRPGKPTLGPFPPLPRLGTSPPSPGLAHGCSHFWIFHCSLWDAALALPGSSDTTPSATPPAFTRPVPCFTFMVTPLENMVSFCLLPAFTPLALDVQISQNRDPACPVLNCISGSWQITHR